MKIELKRFIGGGQPRTKQQEEQGRRKGGRRILNTLVEHLTLGVLVKVGWVLIGVTLFGGTATASPLKAGIDRTPAAAFPYAEKEDDYDDMLEDYQVYLNFVVSVGRRVNSRRARNIAQKFSKLKSQDPREAARYLKGLKYEMDHRRLLTRKSRRALGSGSRYTRRWIGRYLDNWENELDEALFRSYVKRMVARDR